MLREANSKNPELWTNKIALSDHAFKRARERLGYKERQVALGNIRQMLRQAEKIGTVYGNDGNEGVYYAFNKIGIVLNADLTTVVTIKKTEDVTDPLKSKIIILHRKEFNKLDRLEKSRIRKLNIERIRINAEIAQLEYRKVKTRSNNVKKYCNEQIQILKHHILQLEEEIKNIQTIKRQVANSMSSLL